MELVCTVCGFVRPAHEYYRLADGRLTHVTVCRSCRRKQDDKPRITPRGDRWTDEKR